MKYRRSIVWLRRDLRLDDNAAIYEACKQSEAVVLAFVVHPPLLASSSIGAPITHLFFSGLENLRVALRSLKSDLVVLRGDFAQELETICQRLAIEAIFYNRDTDPRACVRDQGIEAVFARQGIAVHPCDDLTYFTADAVVQDSGSTYKVFTPYKRRWLAHRENYVQAPYASRKALSTRLLPHTHLGPVGEVPTPEDFHFLSSSHFPKACEEHARKTLDLFLEQSAEKYADQRNFPSISGTSHLSPQLRAGTIGIRTCVEAAFLAKREQISTQDAAQIETWISELIWRDFYHQILVHYPHVVDQPYDPRGEAVKFTNNNVFFTAWIEARTGYPIIDAAMRQLHTFGWMHNRLRMIVASFLTKDLLIDYRWGERHFEQHLADADLAANNGGWQWASSTGTDAAPYFRVFNPITQSEKFDPDGTFIRQMLPEIAKIPGKTIHAPWTTPPLLLREAGLELGRDYPLPIVDHAQARLLALEAYGAVFGKKSAPLA